MTTSLFLCDCGGALRKSIDFEALEDRLSSYEGVGSVTILSSLCQRDDLERIQREIETRAPSSIVVGACSKRTLLPVLERAAREVGFNASLIEPVNLREQCAWVHDDRAKATQKAERLMKGGIGKSRLLRAIETRETTRLASVLIVGAGVAGIQAALDLANQGFDVKLLDESPTIGGKMALLVKTYPTDDCAICILGPKMAEAASHPNIKLLTYHEVVGAQKRPEGFKVRIRRKPSYVDPGKCTGCGVCAEKCPVKVKNEWNGGLGLRKAIYLPYPQAIPRKYVIDSENCLYLKKGVCRICEKFCPAKAPNFEDKAEEFDLEFGTVILSTGFEEFDPSRAPETGFGKYPDVITQLQLARILDPSGPTDGKLKRPSDGSKPERITMVQCVGSRDPRYSKYCSRYCCMAALKNSVLVKIEQNPQSEITILYKDVRAAGKGFEEYYVRAHERFGVNFVKGDLLEIKHDPSSNELRVEFETENKERREIRSELVVLSAAMVPSKTSQRISEIFGVKTAPDGFVSTVDEKVSTVETNTPGVFVCGAAEGPKDIPESVAQASAAAYKAARLMRTPILKPSSAPRIDEAACGRCGLCIAACPFEAISADDEGIARIDESSCSACGLCMTVCGSRAITAPNNGRSEISQQISGILQGVEKSSPLLLAIGCDECGYTVLDNVGFRKRIYPANVIPMFVPCLASLTTDHLIEALNLGADGLIVIGCEEERCHFWDGAQTAKARVEMLTSILTEFSFADRIRFLALSGNMTEEFVQAARDLAMLTGGV
jgi:heterodisulfide reductase subunit A